MAVVGYARVSTLDQVLDSQLDSLRAAGAERVFSDEASGKREPQPGLSAALQYLRDYEGVLMVTSLDRLGQSVQHLVQVVDYLEANEISFRSLSEGIDTTTAGGEMFFAIFASISQAAARMISERTHEGLANARAQGRRGGRPRAMTPSQLATAIRMRADGRTYDDIGGAIGVSASTVSRTIADALLQKGRPDDFLN